MASWDQMGELANVAQLTGVDAVKLIGMIVRAASTARMHKKNCRQFAQHLKLIGNLLEQLKISELKRYPETREPLEQLEDALRRSYILVNSCQDRSYLYLLAMGWNIVYQFRKAQNEIDRYLRLVPLITLVDNARVRERLEVIEMDQREYTLDDDDQKAQTVIFKPEPDIDDTAVLKKTLSCSYPNCSFTEALKKENEKLKLELQRSQANLDMNQCQVIQRLLDVTEVAAYSVPEKCSPEKNHKKEEYNYSKDHSDNEHSSDEKHHAKVNKHSQSRYSVAQKDLVSAGASYQEEDWHTDLLACCSEPSLCMKTFFYPCGTFSKIASVARNRPISSAEACNDLMAYSLILSCCCYTCCVRRRLRKMLNITGGFIDDFLSHLMCCCCALVQEWREVEIRGIIGPDKTKTSPPPSQYMES
ncbi:protein MID1-COMPLEMENTING ACTIVITY 1 [Vigna radiata var. radiata]|uniref:Protein MID1-COMPLEMENTING ACTIVITY 1 n=1 Tax=Vigna radiata var. radiata TaxID=3916 RepID=A0A1S3VSK0_VIGRR|nr:protein MID1-COMPLEMENTING ACTIVITY 1 [Vigna radiata var. radiata]XP_014521352.1 protein MID1-COMPLEMENTING ACTIVITY 1 [Vigna radiata var. radiata]XP_014521353.1 protein MID1-COMPLEMENTING ACTIVITY 1 [Vigna radiata var. radiata]XP_014521354.1 protein MID1-COMPLEMENTING ACTIVITY 1 [Vigna radiata var. radiata]XP_014521355.1 protein MID1-COMPLEMENTING ACTIVITY 1 [Vigna radiata var. radiata]XP_014521356.1 protein MID1-COMPLEMENTING ACTIVITY 1 [Vigna radiata var. radiata]XP_014521357.1 protein 